MLKINGLTVYYEDNLVLDNINMEFKPGTINVISGLSGCGKTTFIKTINGIIPEIEKAKVSGEIIYKNHNLLKEELNTKTYYISMVFQNPKTQFYCINSTDELAFGLENRNVPKDEMLSIINYYSKELGIEDLLNKDIFKLSGGEKQLLAIGAVACLNNDIYIFDEPSASLDHKAIDRFKKILHYLKEQGKIIIISEHRLYYLREILDTLSVIKDTHMTTFDNDYIDKNYAIVKSEYNLRTIDDILIDDLKGRNITKVKLVDNNTFKVLPICDNMLECINFKTKYNKKVILNVSIDFVPGIHFIIGDNGVGKTTFIKKICGISKGKGKKIYNRKKINAPYKNISLVMQDVNYQIYTDSCYKEMKVIQEDDNVINQCLEKVGLINKKDVHPNTLSGGEKQRLMFAKTMAASKPIIILDEPTSGLDRIQMQRIAMYVEEFRDLGKTIIVITHDYELIKTINAPIMHFIN